MEAVNVLNILRISVVYHFSHFIDENNNICIYLFRNCFCLIFFTSFLFEKNTRNIFCDKNNVTCINSMMKNEMKIYTKIHLESTICMQHNQQSYKTLNLAL